MTAGRAIVALWIACAGLVAWVWLRPMHEGFLPPPVTRAPRFLLVEKPSAPTAISMGMTWDVRRGDPDFPALVVAVSALGEHRQGSAFRLFKELREVRGLNYGAYAYPEHFVQAPGSALPGACTKCSG